MHLYAMNLPPFCSCVVLFPALLHLLISNLLPKKLVCIRVRFLVVFSLSSQSAITLDRYAATILSTEGVTCDGLAKDTMFGDPTCSRGFLWFDGRSDFWSFELRPHMLLNQLRGEPKDALRLEDRRIVDIARSSLMFVPATIHVLVQSNADVPVQ
jgi:hypothetical protein